jgi:ATP-binding cassette subfamily B protein
MRLLLGYLRGYWRLVALALLLAAVNQSLQMVDPLLVRHLLDRYALRVHEYTPQQFLAGVGLVVLVAIIAALISRLAKNFQDYYISVITQRLGAQLYTDGIRHSLQLPYHLFEDQRSGETLGKLQKVRGDVEKLITVSINIVFTFLVALVFAAVYAFTIHWLIAPIFFLTMPLLGVICSFLSTRVKHIQRVIVAQTTALAGATTESLRNIELVKSLGLGEQEIQRLNGTTAKILDLELKKVRYLKGVTFMQGTVLSVLRHGILFLALYLVFRNELTVGDYFSLFIYSFWVLAPMQDLGFVVNTYRETEASLAMFEEILRTPTEQKPTHARRLRDLSTLTFDRVTFQHRSAAAPAVTDVSFEVRRGESVAFVGPSGAGKTTLVKLLVGLYQPRSGEILYNNTPSTGVDLDAIRERIGLVTQDTQLFSGTIRENLLFVNPRASEAECLDALRRAACGDLLARAAQGIDTIIGEGGVKISGGEKQRLSIARALLRSPRLLVFDEATSSLDSLTEEGVVETIRDVAASGDAITILVAHRLSTILHADRIYVLEHGRIIETGRHDELVALGGLYYAMWRQQIGERRGAGAKPALGLPRLQPAVS